VDQGAGVSSSVSIGDLWSCSAEGVRNEGVAVTVPLGPVDASTSCPLSSAGATSKGKNVVERMFT
jgi:hypothetical protein